MEENKIVQLLNGYYSEKLKLHGPNFKGADWGSLHAQQLSFDQLIKLLPKENFSMLDYGCGYGAFYDYLKNKGISADYTGFDISQEMIKHAQLHHENDSSKWLHSIPSDSQFDYVIACGIFSVKLDIPTKDWEVHILQTLEKINEMSIKGFAFNSLTSYSDPHLMKDYLYYPDPAFLFSYCKKHFSKYVTLLHDYPKYEFTMLVKKE